MKLGKRLRKVLSVVLVCLGLAGLVAVATVSPVYATTDSYMDTISEWLPIIVQFAMLGMVMGLLKKFGKW